MFTSRAKIVVIVVIAISVFGIFSNSISAADPVPDYINEVNVTNLVDVATVLVEDYGPRQEDTFSPFIDGSCNFNTAVVYPKSNVDMATDYVRDRFLAMGYAPSDITMEAVPNGAGNNVIVTKIGSEYPNVFIEFSAHIDSVVQTPGGNDNASGSTAVVELARVLKDYPNRYSMRFILWVGEEFDTDRNTAYYGSYYHVQQLIAQGEEIKAGLVIDHIGWPNPADPTGLMNGVSYNNVESERIADMFDQVRTDYGLNLGFDKVNQIFNSDEHSYWGQGFTAVSSGGGWLYYRPEYHDCGDTVANMDFNNILLTTQQNLAVGLRLDQEAYTPGATPTSTSPATATNTPLPTTPTSTPSTPVPTATAVPPTGFPSTTLLDDFNRGNGSLGTNWSGNTGGHQITANQLDVVAGEDIYWNAASFGVDQEIFVTLAGIDSNASEIDLILKSQSSTTFSPGLLEVVYDPGAQRIQVWTYADDQNWAQRGANVSVAFANGDQFGARALADGTVEVFRNGVVVGTWDVSAWTYSANGGFLGLWPINAGNVTLDDFGGGTVGSGSEPTPTYTPAPPTSTATATAVPPTSTPTPIGPTPTNTPTAVATNTPTPTNTPLPPTPTPTATSATGFPSAALLDDFNRADGPLGPNWGGLIDGYSIVSNQLDVVSGDRILWQTTQFGADQEAYVTFSTIDPNAGEQDLLLKSQSATTWLNGVLEVLYNPGSDVVQVWTFAPAQGWQKWGADIPVTFVSGDQFGARALADGSVTLYRNGILFASRDVSGWQFAASSGYIGLWYFNADNAIADDFGGGNVSVGSTPTPTNTPTPTAVPPTPTNTPTPTPTAVPPTPTNTPTPTAVPPTPTNTSTPTPTAVPPTPTNTATPTAVPPTPTNTPTPTATAIPPTPTNTATPTAVPPTPTNTATPTAVPPTPTNTATPTAVPPTPTNTPTPTPTAVPPTPTPSSGFPSTNLLDDFNQVDTEMSANWGGFTSNYSVVSNALNVGGDTIFWQAESFGQNQEVFVTLTDVDETGTEHDLILKSQSGTTWTSGILEVWYDAVNERIQVWTFATSQGWIKHGGDIPVTFADGDQFGAKALADGSVEVYRNGNLIGTVDVSLWPYATSGGYLGMWFFNADAIVDDFGGGTVLAP